MEAKLAPKYRHGEDNPAAVATNRDVEHMRLMREQGYSLQQLADIFEMSKTQVYRICTYKDRGVIEGA